MNYFSIVKTGFIVGNGSTPRYLEIKHEMKSNISKLRKVFDRVLVGVSENVKLSKIVI